MNREHENGAIRNRVARARVHQASGRRRLLWALAGLAALAAVGGGGRLDGVSSGPGGCAGIGRGRNPDSGARTGRAARGRTRIRAGAIRRTRTGTVARDIGSRTRARRAAPGRTRIRAGVLRRTRTGAVARDIGLRARARRAAPGRTRTAARSRRRTSAGTGFRAGAAGRSGRAGPIGTGAGRGSATPSRRHAEARLDRRIALVRTPDGAGTDRARQGKSSRSVPRRRRRFGAPAPGRRATGGR